MTKIPFFYCQGTSWPFNFLFDLGYFDAPLLSGGPPSTYSRVIRGLNGTTVRWDCSPPNDPFPYMLDQTIFDSYRVRYPASMFPIAQSVESGVARVTAAIKNIPSGVPFGLGGYSQGALVMSQVAKKGLLPGTSGELSAWQGQFMAGIMFGNPCRATNHRGEIGGTYSGSYDVPGSTSGGHGIMPATGQYARLTSAPAHWIEFAHKDDVATCVGDSALGTGVSAIADALFSITGTPRSIFGFNILGFIANLGNLLPAACKLIEVAGHNLTHIDATGTYFSDLGGNGHTAYALMPPTGNDGVNDLTGFGGMTSFQLGLKYLTDKAGQFGASPTVLPTNPIVQAPSATGWSTNLSAPQ